MTKNLTLFLAAVIPFAIYFVAKRIYYAYFNMPTKSGYTVEDNMRAVAELQANLAIDTGDIVFVGNSLTSNFPIYEMFGSTKYKNRGIGSNTTVHVLNRIRKIAEACPSVILLEAGINDLNNKRPVNETFDTYKQIITVIQQVSPKTKIIVQSTTPVCKESFPLQPGVDSLNSLLEQHCRAGNIMYLDVNPVLRKGPGLDSTLTWDGIHLNIEGYKRWYDTVKKFL